MNVGQRLQSILSDAESTARHIVDQAEDEAQRYVDGVRQESDRVVAHRAGALAELSDSLIEHAELLKRRSRELLDSLESEPEFPLEQPLPAREAFPMNGATNGATAFEVAPEPTFGHEPDQSMPADPDDESGERYSAGARLLATQMAVAGSSVEDVRGRLVNEFGIADPQPLLDLVFGLG